MAPNTVEVFVKVKYKWLLVFAYYLRRFADWVENKSISITSGKE